ncbi:Alpha-macroglobulin complement component [Trinorchestia longiramus]|nr:Alpha-macroglobulin complement component [Trinorchestia longiramus]
MEDMKVPSSSGTGEYRLKVEGSEVGWLVGSAFSREARLQFKPLGPSVLVHTDRPVYTQGDTVPPFISTDSAVLAGVVYANYTSGAPVSGNITVRASVRSLLPDHPHLHFAPDPTLLMPVTSFYGSFPFRFHLTDLGDLLPSGGLENSEVTISAHVGDMIWNIMQDGFSKTRIIESKLRLRFLGDSPHILRPSMPFKFYLAATQGSSAQVPAARLSRHRLLVTPEVTLRNGRRHKLHPRTVKRLYHDQAMWTAEVDLHVELADYEVEAEVATLLLTAELKEAAGGKSYAKLMAVTHHSPGGRFLQISTSTRDPQVGEYIILHVRSNFYMESFRYLLLNKGLIVEAGQQKMEASLRTFPLALDASLAGSAIVIVYWTGRGGALVADSLTFPVNAVTRETVGLDVMSMQRSRQPIKLEHSKFASRRPREVDPIEEAAETAQELMPLSNVSNETAPTSTSSSASLPKTDYRLSSAILTKEDETPRDDPSMEDKMFVSLYPSLLLNATNENDTKNLYDVQSVQMYASNFMSINNSMISSAANVSFDVENVTAFDTTDILDKSTINSSVSNIQLQSRKYTDDSSEATLAENDSDSISVSENDTQRMDFDLIAPVKILKGQANENVTYMFSRIHESDSTAKNVNEMNEAFTSTQSSSFSSHSIGIENDPSFAMQSSSAPTLMPTSVSATDNSMRSTAPSVSYNSINDSLNFTSEGSETLSPSPEVPSLSYSSHPHLDSSNTHTILSLSSASMLVNKTPTSSPEPVKQANFSGSIFSNAVYRNKNETKAKFKTSQSIVKPESLLQTSTWNYSEVLDSTSSSSMNNVEATEDLPYTKLETDSSVDNPLTQLHDSLLENDNIREGFNSDHNFAEYDSSRVEADDGAEDAADEDSDVDTLSSLFERDEFDYSDSLPLLSREHRRRDLRRYEYADDVKEDVLRLTVKGIPGARVSLAGYSWDKFGMTGGSEMNPAQVLREMTRSERSEGDKGSVPYLQEWSAVWSDTEELVRLPRSSLGVDANDTFALADVLVLTDANDWSASPPCQDPRQLPCLLSGCYSKSAACDDHWDCPDGLDERMCDRTTPGETDIGQFLLSRQKRLARHVSPPWLWKQLTINETGMASITVLRPQQFASPLILSGFSLHKLKGLSLLQKPVQWADEDSFQLRVEAPERAGAWEHVGIRVTALNRHVEDVTAHITLAHSTDYKFVALEDFDVTGFESEVQQRRRFAEGEHQHTIHVGGGGSITLYLPIVPFKLGEVTVQVTAVIPGKKLRAQVTIRVEAMGAAQQHHTSLLVDLSNRPYYFTFLDINIPAPGSFVPGSTRASIAVSGDTICPIPTLKLDRTRISDRQRIASPTASTTASLNLPTSGSESAIYSILLTALQLQHLQQQQQLLQPNRDIYTQLQLQYQSLLAHQGADGGFKFFSSQSKSPSSVWLSATAVRALHQLSAVAPHLVYVDPQTKDRALRFVLSHQTSYGAWWEPGTVLGARQFQPSSYSFANETTLGLNLTTSAHILLQLLTLTQLPSPLDERVQTAISRGRSWLEHSLRKVERASRPLEAALVALALHEARSPLAEAAFGILARNARQEVKYVYWGEDLVPLPSYRVESQRPHLQPRSPHRHDSGNIAATAYALRVYTSRGELMAPAIVRWLHSQRAHDYGWMSTQDTLAAWEALQHYSVKMSTARDTHIAVTVEPLADTPLAKLSGYSSPHYEHEVPSHTFHITDNNLLQLQSQPISPEWGSARVRAKGKGWAVLQLTARYSVMNDHQLQQPPVRAFTLNAKAWPSSDTSLLISACVRWVYRSAADASGLSVLEVTLPTGYGANKASLDALLMSPEAPTLRKIMLTQRSVNFFFDQLGGSNTCVELVVERWFPVANLTSKLPVTVYEFHAPELKTIEFLDMSEVTFDICQVCGSYQCPNCPEPSYYLSSTEMKLPNILLIASAFSVVILPSISLCSLSYSTLSRYQTLRSSLARSICSIATDVPLALFCGDFSIVLLMLHHRSSSD